MAMKRSHQNEMDFEEKRTIRSKRLRNLPLPRSTRGFDTSSRLTRPLQQVMGPSEESRIRASRSMLCEDSKTFPAGSLESNRAGLLDARGQFKPRFVQIIADPLLARGREMLEAHEIVLPVGESLETYCKNIALDVERAAFDISYKAGKHKSDYKHKLTTIAFNLGKNILLANEVIWRGIKGSKLADMTTDEMANKELKDFINKTRIQSEINSTLVKLEGPRIRKTHKGEELVEELEELKKTPDFDDSLFSPVRDMEDSSHKTAASVEAQLRVPNPASANVTSRGSKAPHIFGHGVKPLRNQRVLVSHTVVCSDSEGSSILSPHTPVRRPLSREVSQYEVGNYSTAINVNYCEATRKRDDILEWVGRIEMTNIASLCTTAKLCGGPEFISGVKWSTLLEELLNTDGDVSAKEAEDYLAALGSSTSSSMVMVNLSPMDRADKPEFEKLCEHFSSIRRYAVVGAHYRRCIKSVHFFFLGRSADIPAWFALLNPPSTIACSGRQRGLLLLVFSVIHDLIESNESHTNKISIDDEDIVYEQEVENEPVTHQELGDTIQNAIELDDSSSSVVSLENVHLLNNFEGMECVDDKKVRY